MGKVQSIASAGAVVALVFVVFLALASVALALPGDFSWSLRNAAPGEDAGRALAVTPAGDLVFAADLGTTSADPSIAVYSFTSAPSDLYYEVYGDANGVADSVTALALAADGSPFLAGWTQGASARQDYLLTHFSTAGVLAGERMYDGPLHRTDTAAAVAVDAGGSCFVTGSSQSKRAAGDYDIVTVKYDPVGMQAWVKRFDAGKLNDRAVAVAVRGASLYVTGTSRRDGHGDDTVLLKYDAVSGRLLWSRFYDDSTHRHDAPTDLVVTGKGVFVAGFGKQGKGRQSDALVLRYTFAGVRKWARYTGGSGADVWADIEAGPDGLIRATGTTRRSATAADVMTASWRSDGTFAWRTTFSTVGTTDERAVALAVDSTGATFVAVSQENETDVDYRVVAYTAAGGTLWYSDPYGVFPGFDDVPDDIAVTAARVIVAGSSETMAGGDWLVAAFEK